MGGVLARGEGSPSDRTSQKKQGRLEEIPQSSIIVEPAITQKAEINNRGSRRPSLKVSLTEEEMQSAAACFTFDNTNSSANADISLVLLPHEHSLFCERKERVCTSMGRLQEREFATLKFSNSKDAHVLKQSLQWYRSTCVGQAGAEQTQESELVYNFIAGTEGCEKYELSADDVGCFLKVSGRLKLDASTAEAIPSESSEVAFETINILGPVTPGPPRLLSIGITGVARVGQQLVADVQYIGGVQGLSEFWWMRIRNGERENVSEPVALTEAQVHAALPAAEGDPRMYTVLPTDVGCQFKLKCRPVRSDGYRGEVFTSKPSATVTA